MDKKKYYEQKRVATEYIQERYGGKTGEWIKKRELGAVKELLPEKGDIIDIGCGTGRLHEILEKDHHVLGIDSSKEMLRICQHKDKKEGDAKNLPVRDRRFDCAILLRLAFHYKDIRPFLQECKRVTKKQGYIIFETYSWSPREHISIKSLGGKIYAHKEKEIKKILEELGLKYIQKKSIFLLSPSLQKHFPLGIAKMLERIEKKLPDKLKVDNYWKVQV